MRNPLHGRSALRRGRASLPGAEYFLTLCTEGRRSGLTERAVAEAIIRELWALDADGTWALRCAVVMPDHVHVSAVLGNRLTLGQCVGRFKAKTASALRTLSAAWERDFFDHRIRPDEDRAPAYLYVYLNPYRAGLCPADARWPWQVWAQECWTWFGTYLHADLPPPQWLA
jgi:putative transposase